MININETCPTNDRNGLSNECGDNASAKVIIIGIATKAIRNCV